VSEACYLSPKEAPAGVGITSFEYEAEIPAGLDVESMIPAFLAKDSAVITRVSDKGNKDIDIRPMVQDLRIVPFLPPSPFDGRGAGGEGALRDGRTAVFTLTEVNGKGAKPFEAAQAIFGLSREQSKTVRIKRLRMF
ncbi:MAG: DUF2344 domain-containing protein, partial [Nitrospirota bacterium]